MGAGLDYNQSTGDWGLSGYFEGAVGFAASAGWSTALTTGNTPSPGIHTASNANFGAGGGTISGNATYNVTYDRNPGSGWSGNGGLSVGGGAKFGAEATYSGGITGSVKLFNDGKCP